jgi:hypothetical protein
VLAKSVCVNVERDGGVGEVGSGDSVGGVCGGGGCGGEGGNCAGGYGVPDVG